MQTIDQTKKMCIRDRFQLLPAVLACVLGALLLKRYFALPVRPEGRQDGGAGVLDVYKRQVPRRRLVWAIALILRTFHIRGVENLVCHMAAGLLQELVVKLLDAGVFVGFPQFHLCLLYTSRCV